MKKLLTIVASVLTLGAFAADNDITIQFVAPDGASAENAYTVVETTTDTTVEADLDFGCLPYYIVATIAAEDYPTAGTYALAENGIILSESVPMAPMSAPRLAGLKLAGEETNMEVAWSNLGSDKGVNMAGAADVKLCLRATDEAPVGSKVKLTKIVIADRPSRDHTTPCYKITIDGTDYYTEERVAGDEVVVNTSAAEASQVKRGTSIYTFAEGSEPTLSVGVVYDLATCNADHTAQTGRERGGATCAQLEGANVNPATNGILWWNATVSTSNGWNILGEIYGEVTEVPSREATTVYATSKAMNAFVDADGNAVEELVMGDTINLGTKTTGNVWGGGANITDFAAYQIVVENMEMDLGAGSGVPENGKLTINYRDSNKGIYLYGNIGANAKIDGTGLLYLGHTGDACSIGNGTVISCDIAFQNTKKVATINGAVSITGTITMGNGEFKLADGATLTVAAKLDDGKVTPAGSKKRVAFNETTKTYSLVQQREMTVRVVENTTRYYLNAKDENGTSTEMIAIEGNSVLIDNGTGFTAYYIANEGYELSKGDGSAAKISSDKKMAWYYYTTVTSDQNYDAQVTATAVAPVVPGIDLIPEDQKTGYPAWLEANITTETTLEVKDIAAAFLLGATVSEGVTIEDAAQAKVKELLKDIDLSALATEGEDAALTALNTALEAKGLAASLAPVELEGASESTKLYKLVIKLIEQN